MLETSGKSLFYAKGLKFSCIRCSACCRHDAGYVFLSLNDTSRLEAALNISHEEFTYTYCRWIPSLSGILKLSLKEKYNFDCIFWAEDEGGCSVYEARPLQCRAFPFWDSALNSPRAWKALAKDCPGMNQGSVYSEEEINKWLSLREKEPIIFRRTEKEGEF